MWNDLIVVSLLFCYETVINICTDLFTVFQVLRILHYLAKFGYYGDMDDIEQLMIPLLSLLDGRNDKPYPNKDGL